MKRRPLHLFAGVAIGLFAAAAWAQSPFQSAPGPASVVTSRPAPHPRPQQRQQQDEELPPTVTTVQPPMPAPAPPPPPPSPPSLAGVWHFQSSCPLDPGADMNITQSAPDQYLISGSAGLLPVAVNGWINGKIVHMEADAPFNHVVSQGTVTSPTTMSGHTTQTLMGINCDWVGQKK